MISRPEDPHPRTRPLRHRLFHHRSTLPPFSPFISFPYPGSARWCKSTTFPYESWDFEEPSLYLSLSFYSETISCNSFFFAIPSPLPSIHLTLSTSYSLPSQGWMYWRDFAATFRDKKDIYIFFISFPFADFGFLFSYLRFSCLLMSCDIIYIYDVCPAEILLVYFSNYDVNFIAK